MLSEAMGMYQSMTFEFSDLTMRNFLYDLQAWVGNIDKDKKKDFQ